ncbi:MAG: hypothetical protein HOP16_12575 [Acidobacteria bacterium]|nr:hypothetical protein [Acidobacteriota bacterium]
MRADAHYVDLIEGRALQTPKTSVPPAAVQETAPRVTDFADPTLHAGSDLAQALTTLTSCAALLSDAPSELSRAVVSDLIKAEAWRASMLLHATRVVRKELSITRSAVSVSGILDKVILGVQPERRVRALTIDARSALPYGAVVVGDEQMVTGAISCALLATLAVVRTVPDARVTISASSDPTTGVAFTVSQPSVTPPSIWQARAFDPTWTDRPGGVSALLWMLALQETAQAHGGTARVERSDRGTTIGLSLAASL